MLDGSEIRTQPELLTGFFYFRSKVMLDIDTTRSHRTTITFFSIKMRYKIAVFSIITYAH